MDNTKNNKKGYKPNYINFVNIFQEIIEYLHEEIENEIENFLLYNVENEFGEYAIRIGNGEMPVTYYRIISSHIGSSVPDYKIYREDESIYENDTRWLLTYPLLVDKLKNTFVWKPLPYEDIKDDLILVDSDLFKRTSEEYNFFAEEIEEYVGILQEQNTNRVMKLPKECKLGDLSESLSLLFFIGGDGYLHAIPLS